MHLNGSSTATLERQQYVKIALGTVQNITNIKLNCEVAYAKGYSIQVSNDGTNFSPVFSTLNGDGNTDNISLSASGRYVKLALSEKGTICFIASHFSPLPFAMTERKTGCIIRAAFQ